MVVPDNWMDMWTQSLATLPSDSSYASLAVRTLESIPTFTAVRAAEPTSTVASELENTHRPKHADIFGVMIMQLLYRQVLIYLEFVTGSTQRVATWLSVSLRNRTAYDRQVRNVFCTTGRHIRFHALSQTEGEEKERYGSSEMEKNDRKHAKNFREGFLIDVWGITTKWRRINVKHIRTTLFVIRV